MNDTEHHAPSTAGGVRLDKWLWAARFYKTRSLAQQAIELGRVRIDGDRIKPARLARIGDVLDLHLGEQRWTIEVRALSSQRGPAPVAQQLYQETPASAARRAQRALVARVDPARDLRGRPTKKEGRVLRRLIETN